MVIVLIDRHGIKGEALLKLSRNTFWWLFMDTIKQREYCIFDIHTIPVKKQID